MKHTIEKIKQKFEKSSFAFSYGADKDNNPDGIGLSFKAQLNKKGDPEEFYAIFIPHGAYEKVNTDDYFCSSKFRGYGKQIHLDYRYAPIHCGFKAMDRIRIDLGEKAFEGEQSFLEYLPKSLDEIRSVIQEFKYRILGETTQEEYINFINQLRK